MGTAVCSSSSARAAWAGIQAAAPTAAIDVSQSLRLQVLSLTLLLLEACSTAPLGRNEMVLLLLLRDDNAARGGEKAAAPPAIHSNAAPVTMRRISNKFTVPVL